MSNRAFCGLKNYEAYLASGRAPRWAMEASDIHGFFAGLALAGSVPEGTWMPLIWSGEVPQFATPEESRIVLAELRRFHDNILRDLDRPGYRLMPLLLEDSSGGYFAGPWAEGFLQAIELNPDPWRPAMDLAPDSVGIVLHSCFSNQDDLNTGVLSGDELQAMLAHLKLLQDIMAPAAGIGEDTRQVA